MSEKAILIEREPEPKLDKAENPWKPRRLEPKYFAAVGNEEEQTAVRGCLLLLR